jgi:hypothetical protein
MKVFSITLKVSSKKNKVAEKPVVIHLNEQKFSHQYTLCFVDINFRYYLFILQYASMLLF